MAGDTPKKVEEPDATREIVERNHSGRRPFPAIRKRATLEIKRDGYHNDIYNLKYHPEDNRYTMKLVHIGKPKKEESGQFYLYYILIAVSIFFLILWLWVGFGISAPKNNY